MEFKIKETYTFDDLLKIVEMLRDKDNGCPWDKEQTHESIRKNFIEETYEAVDAIDKKDPSLLEEELGDVLLQVLLHAQFEKEQGTFDFSNVANSLAQKLVLRHPHIFKNDEINQVEGVLQRWEEIKNESHGHTTVSQTVNAVPKNFPALMYAQKVQKRVAAGGVKVHTGQEEIENIHDQLEQISQQMQQGKAQQASLGQLLFSCVNLVRQNKQDAEEILALTTLNFVDIFNVFEDLALQKNTEFGKMECDDLYTLWQKAQELVNQR